MDGASGLFAEPCSNRFTGLFFLAISVWSPPESSESIDVRPICFSLLLSLSFAVGCSYENPDAGIPPQGSAAKSPLEYVNQSMMGKMTPSGARFQPESAKDLGGGKFEIKDTAGAKYHVTVTPSDKGFTATDPAPAK